MQDTKPKSNQDVDKLKKDIEDLKADIAYLKKVILQVNIVKADSKDKQDLRNLEATIKAL